LNQPAPRGLSLIELRRLAVRALAEVISGGKTIDDAILFVSTKNSGRTLAVFDRSWIMEITSGVLRYRGRIDFIIDTYALKKKPSGPLRRYLQTAVYQLLTSDSIEPALVVSETVHAIRENEGEPPSKFANAILRKIAEQRSHWRSWKVSESTPEAERIAWSSLPGWLYKNLVKQKGLEWTHAFAQACLERPRTWYRKLPAAPETGAGETIELTEGYQGDEPRGYVQDIANQELVDDVVKLLGQRFSSAQQPKILDLCAAPGGKSMGLAAAGFPVIATDYDENRLQKVIENRNRLGFKHIETKAYNEITMLADRYDVIWIDAPCSSTGILRRHPEVRWNREAEQIKKWVETQGKLVEWAREHLKDQGILIYSTCSVLSVENRANIEGFEPLQVFERAPQDFPHGDGIYAWIGTRS
jgi:16S rRNA (cytosine967-C5)-methyltransferase